MRKALLLFLLAAVIPAFTHAQVITPGTNLPPNNTCGFDPQVGTQGGIPCSPPPWYQSPAPSASCGALVAGGSWSVANGNGTQMYSNTDPYYNKRALITIPQPTPTGNAATGWNSMVCNFDRSTGTTLTSQIEINGAPTGGTCPGGATGHVEPQALNLAQGYNGIWNCGAYGNAQIQWKDRTGATYTAMPFAIGNCVGSTDCTNYGTGAKDITTAANYYYLPLMGLSEGAGVIYGNSGFICGQNNNVSSGGYRTGSQACATIRATSTQGSYTVDTAHTSGGTVVATPIATPLSIPTIMPYDPGIWQVGTNVHTDMMGGLDLGGASTTFTLTFTFPAVAGFAGATCTYTTTSSNPSIAVNALVSAFNAGTFTVVSGSCSSVPTYFAAFLGMQANARGGVTMTVVPHFVTNAATTGGTTTTLSCTGTGCMPATFTSGSPVLIDDPYSGIQETKTINTVTSGTNGSISLTAAVTSSHQSGIDVSQPFAAWIVCKACNPDATANMTVTGCTGCTYGWTNTQANTAGNGPNHFGYGQEGSRFNVEGTLIYGILQDTQLTTANYAGDAGVNGYALNLFAWFSRGPDLTCTGATNTFGHWCWGDAEVVNQAGPTDGATRDVSPGTANTVAVGSTAPPGTLFDSAGPYASCPNTSGNPCTTTFDNGTTTNSIAVGLVQPCTGTCTPPSGWVEFVYNTTLENQANMTRISNSTLFPINATNYDWAINDQDNVVIGYDCPDSTKIAGTGSAAMEPVEFCYRIISSTTGQTINAGFIDDTNTNTVLQQPGLAFARAPSGHLVMLAAIGSSTYPGCNAVMPCLIQYVSTNHGVTWTKTKLTDPSWAHSGNFAGGTCSLYADPDGWHIWAGCVPGGSVPGSTLYYTYDLYLGGL